jgi:hypothetical protein
MKLVRYGRAQPEKPGLLDEDGVQVPFASSVYEGRSPSRWGVKT